MAQAGKGPREISRKVKKPYSTVYSHLKRPPAVANVPLKERGVGTELEVAHGARILTLDIETAPIVANVWGLWKVNVGLNQIICDWCILSYSAKWLGESEVLYRDNRGQGASPVTQDVGVRDDSALLLELHALLNTADIVVAQNGVRFDSKKINARFLVAGLPPVRPYKIVDTMLIAKEVALFTSNRLAWLSEALTPTVKSEHKKFPGFELWTECLADNPEAWQEMEEYNKIDVVSTEQLYLRLRPWTRTHPNVAAYDTDDTMRCPVCGGEHLQKRGTYVTNAGKYLRYVCTSCHAWSRTRYTNNTMSKRKSLLGS